MIADSYDQLQPCPFCGGNASYVEQLKTMHIKCDGCGLETPEQSSFDPKFDLEQSRLWAKTFLKDHWNQRDGEKTITTKFQVQTRDTYADRKHWADSRGQWKSGHTVDYPTNPTFPPEYCAKKLARDRLERIKTPELDEDDYDHDDHDQVREPKYYPIPIFSEYRVIRITKIEEVIEYGNSKAGGPVYQKDPDLDAAIQKQKQQDEELEKMMAEDWPCPDCNDEGCDPCGAVTKEDCIC